MSIYKNLNGTFIEEVADEDLNKKLNEDAFAKAALKRKDSDIVDVDTTDETKKEEDKVIGTNDVVKNEPINHNNPSYHPNHPNQPPNMDQNQNQNQQGNNQM